MFVICATKNLENWTNWINTSNSIIQKAGHFNVQNVQRLSIPQPNTKSGVNNEQKFDKKSSFKSLQKELDEMRVKAEILEKSLNDQWWKW